MHSSLHRLRSPSERKRIFSLAALFALAVLAQGRTSTGPSSLEDSSFAATKRADRENSDVTPYPFHHCAVNRKPFDEDDPKHRRVYEGQEVLFCCTPCVRAFDANPDPYMPRIVAAAEAKKEKRSPGSG